MANHARGVYGLEGELFIKETPHRDIEQHATAEDLLCNTTVRHISWSGITVTVKDRETKQPKVIVDNVGGYVEAGQLLALMGPSGCGKTTLLNVLASRPTGAAHVDGTVRINGATPSKASARQTSRFVEQDDALIGSLTVRETLHFAARLAGAASKSARRARVESLVEAFGLRGQADAIVGTPIRKGISGGQKRRVGIASQLITGPRLIVIASIHQPSTSTFNLFDKLLLLSGGKTHYFGPLQTVVPYYESIGCPVPVHVNPAEFLLEQVNVDFVSSRAHSLHRLKKMQQAWVFSSTAAQLSRTVARCCEDAQRQQVVDMPESFAAAEEKQKPSFPSLVLTLLHRSFIKSYRDVIAYGVRAGMYLGLAIMMGTVWFFGGAFMSFMAVAYVPAFLEDRHQYVKEHHNGLYGAGALVVSNLLVGIPYLFAIALGFSAISYWLSGFHPSAPAFFTWVLWLFLDLLAAEGLVVLLAALAPNFVVAPALVAFANGLWMCVNGFMVPPEVLNVFYRYVFSYWDYQKYVFEGMMVNEFAGRVYECGEGCRCMYHSALAEQCLIAGEGVLAQYGYEAGYLGKNVGVMIGIMAGYRIAAWLVLMWRR